MKAPLKILAAALCGLLLGLPVAQADDSLDSLALQVDDYSIQPAVLSPPLEVANFAPETDVFIYFGTADNEMTVSPAEVTLQVGQPYRIVVINPSEDSHIVAASEELAATMRTTSVLKGTPMVRYPSNLISSGILVGPGEMMEWSFTPLQDGKGKLGCSTPLHADAGMHTMITVVPEAL